MTNLPIENEYPKLVRDKIPEIIKQLKGLNVPVRQLSEDSEFLEYLLKKIVEEAGELSQATTDSNLKEEIANVYEIVDAEMHVDEEQYLLEQGSDQQDLWGINLYPSRFGSNSFIEFDSMINIRPRQGNMSRSVENTQIQEQTRQLVLSKVSE